MGALDARRQTGTPLHAILDLPAQLHRQRHLRADARPRGWLLRGNHDHLHGGRLRRGRYRRHQGELAHRIGFEPPAVHRSAGPRITRRPWPATAPGWRSSTTATTYAPGSPPCWSAGHERLPAQRRHADRAAWATAAAAAPAIACRRLSRTSSSSRCSRTRLRPMTLWRCPITGLDLVPGRPARFKAILPTLRRVASRFAWACSRKTAGAMSATRSIASSSSGPASPVSGLPQAWS